MIVPRSTFNLAMAALQDANTRYLHACRAHCADLLTLGTPRDQVERFLAPLDAVEAEQDGLVETLWEMAA